MRTRRRQKGVIKRGSTIESRPDAETERLDDEREGAFGQGPKALSGMKIGDRWTQLDIDRISNSLVQTSQPPAKGEEPSKKAQGGKARGTMLRGGKRRFQAREGTAGTGGSGVLAFCLLPLASCRCAALVAPSCLCLLKFVPLSISCRII